MHELSRKKIGEVRREEFQGTELVVVEHRGEEWFTADDIGRALGFAGDAGKAIRKIHERNQEEFEGLSVDVKLTSTDGKRYTQRIFNAQAAVKFGFFAKTKRAKAFRHWASRFLTEGVKRLKDRHEADQKRVLDLENQLLYGLPGKKHLRPTLPSVSKAAQRIRRLEKRVQELKNERDAVGDSARYLIKECHKDLDRLRALLDQGVEARLLEARNVVAVPWQSLQKLVGLAGSQEENLGTRLLHAVLNRQEEYEQFLNHLKAKIGKFTITLDPEIYCREIEDLAESYRSPVTH